METTATKSSSKRTRKIPLNATSTPGKPKLPKTLEALQFLRTAKGKSDSQIASILDASLKEVKSSDMQLMLERIMIHVGDVSRFHNVLREAGIKSETGGSQERSVFRSVMRWWEKAMPESFKRNIGMIAEFTLYENLMFYQITSDRKTGKIQKEEILFPMPKAVQEFLAGKIREGKDFRFIARHLPKSDTGKNRVTKKIVKAKKDRTEFTLNIPGKEWIKVNGERVEGPKFAVKAGDVVTYSRSKQATTLKKQSFINGWIKDFCSVMGWTLDQYRDFRKNQNSAEQKFSSKEILGLAKSDFDKFLDTLTAGQRFRVAKMVAYKDEKTGKLAPRPKWGRLGEWYIAWEGSQAVVADSLRELATRGVESTPEKKALMSQLKVKATGMQTIDLVVKLLEGKYSEDQINTTYQALIEKMDLIANVFPIIDGSGSMDANDILVNGVRLNRRLVAYTLCIAFSTRNPVDSFRNTYGWFSSNFEVCGNSQYVDTRPNPYLSRASYRRQVPQYAVLSPGKTFTDNLAAIKAADPQEVSSTNMSSSLEYFMKLVKDGKCTVEDLPQALLFVTDAENNTGTHPKIALQNASKIGWNPLVIVWSLIQMSRTMQDLKDTQNVLLVSGFNEGVLSQVLRNIKTGSIDPETELWAIYDDPRYSVIK